MYKEENIIFSDNNWTTIRRYTLYLDSVYRGLIIWMKQLGLARSYTKCYGNQR